MNELETLKTSLRLLRNMFQSEAELFNIQHEKYLDCKQYELSTRMELMREVCLRHVEAVDGILEAK